MRIFAKFIGVAALFAAALVQAADVTIDFQDPHIPDIGPRDGSGEGFVTQGYRFSFTPEPNPAGQTYWKLPNDVLGVRSCCLAIMELAEGGVFSIGSIDAAVGFNTGFDVIVTGYRPDGSSIEKVFENVQGPSRDTPHDFAVDWNNLVRVEFSAPDAMVIVLRRIEVQGGPEPVRYHSFIRSLGDISGDGIAEQAVVDRYGAVTVKDHNDAAVAEFAFTRMLGAITDIEVLADINGNGTPELAMQNAFEGMNEVRDSLTGELLLHQAIVSGDAVDLEILPDVDGSGVPELVNLGDNGPRIETNDALSGVSLGGKSTSRYYTPLDIEVLPDMDSDGLPEVGILSASRTAGKAGRLDVRDPLTGVQLALIRLSGKWQVLGQEVVGDLDDDGYPEVAVLRTEVDGDRVQVVIISTGPNGGYVRQAPMDAGFTPHKLFVISDVNGNGATEIVVFGINAAGKQKAQIKDSLTGKSIRSIYFPPHLEFADVAHSRDLNDNGSQELVVLGKKTDGSYRVTVKDTKTGRLIDRVTF